MKQIHPVDVTVECWECGEVRFYEEIACRPEDFSHTCDNPTCLEFGQRVGWTPNLCHVINPSEKVALHAEAKAIRGQSPDEALRKANNQGEDRRLGFTLAERIGQTYRSLSHDDD